MAQQIQGVVNDAMEAVVILTLVNGAEIACLVDTGFDGAVVLPRPFVEEHHLPSEGGEWFRVVGRKKPVKAKKVTVGLRWLGQDFDVSGVVNEEGLALIGTELLVDCRLTVDYVTRMVLIEQTNF